MPNDSQLAFYIMTEASETGVGWTRKVETTNHEYAGLSYTAFEFGPKKLYANLGKAAGSGDKDLYAAVWDCFDQTKAPAQVLHGGNHL